MLVILIFATAATGVFFLRETKNEVALKNMYTEIVPEEDTTGLGIDMEISRNSNMKLKFDRSSNVD